MNAIIVEAWAKRRYRASFVNKIDDALGEATEIQAWLDQVFDCGYVNQESRQRLDARRQATGGKRARMIDRADDFCKFAPDTDYRKSHAG